MLERKEILTTKNLVLKSIEDDDRNDVFSVFENPLVGKTYMTPVFENDEARERFFSRLKENTLKTTRFCYGIYCNKSFIGLLNDVDVKNDEVEVGYCLHPNYWNKGYATEALKVAIKELFRIGYKTVVAPNPCPENKELLIIPDASHCDLYDGGFTEPVGQGEPKNLIPWDKLAAFFEKNL